MTNRKKERVIVNCMSLQHVAEMALGESDLDLLQNKIYSLEMPKLKIDHFLMSI